MRKYPREHWQVLGNLVSTARHQAGYADTEKWAAAIGRSTRVALGLERGESVGAKTLERISEVLGISNWSLFAVLDSGREYDPWTDQDTEHMRERYEEETGLEADEGDDVGMLTHVSDDALVAELSRRLATRPLTRSERRMREVDEMWEEGGAAAADAPHPTINEDTDEVVLGVDVDAPTTPSQRPPT